MNNAQPERSDQTLLSFDFGEKRIGVAVGQTISRTAQPLTILQVHNGKIDWQGISRLIEDWQPDALIVGMPTNYAGELFGLAERVRRFCRQLDGRYHRPVHTMNENLSSKEARNRLTKKSLRDPLDAYAAQVILESWIEDNT